MIQYVFRKQAFQNRVSTMGLFVKHSPVPFLYLKRIAPISALTANQNNFFEMYSFQRKGICRASACFLSVHLQMQHQIRLFLTNTPLHWSCITVAQILQWKQINTTNVCFISTLRYSEILILLAPEDLCINSKFQLIEVRGTN